MTFDQALRVLRTAVIITPFPEPGVDRVASSAALEPFFRATNAGLRPCYLFLDANGKPAVWTCSYASPWQKHQAPVDYLRCHPYLEFELDYWLLAADGPLTDWIRRQRYIRQAAIPR